MHDKHFSSYCILNLFNTNVSFCISLVVLLHFSSAARTCFGSCNNGSRITNVFFCISLVLFKCICCHIIWSLQQWIPIILTQQLLSQHSMPDVSLAMTFSMEILIKCPACFLSKNYLLLHVSQLSAPF